MIDAPDLVNYFLRDPLTIVFAFQSFRVYNVRHEFPNGLVEPPVALGVVWLK